MTAWTIGFTQRSAQEFFEVLQTSGARRIVDVRLNNSSQLSGFSKKGDLSYFARVIAGIDYVYVPQLAPTKSLLDEYKKRGGSWQEYEQRYVDLISRRGVENSISRDLIEDGCLLCSEFSSARCHRRLALDYLRNFWPDLQVEHL